MKQFTSANNKENNTDILISGAGIPGLTAALLLAAKGFSICIIDPFPLPTLKGIEAGNRTTALMNNAVSLLEKTGAWDACRPHSAPLETLCIIDDSDREQDRITANFKADEINQTQFGMNIPNNILRAALAAVTIENEHITLLQTKLSTLETTENAAIAGLENGRKIKAKLVIGADGRSSMVRQQSKINVTEKDYGQKAIICHFHHTLSHNNISTEFHRPTGPFTLVPLPDHQSSLVWVDETSAIDRFMALDKKSFQQAVQDRSAGLLGAIKDISPPEAWPLKRAEAARLIAPRTALIAEAAHILHPMGAQGLNLSLRDVETLVDIILGAAKLGLDYGNPVTLEQYETARFHDIRNRIRGTDGLTQLLCTDSLFIKALRRRGLKIISTVAPLKKILMREGLSPSKTKSTSENANHKTSGSTTA